MRAALAVLVFISGCFSPDGVDATSLPTPTTVSVPSTDPATTEGEDSLSSSPTTMVTISSTSTGTVPPTTGEVTTTTGSSTTDPTTETTELPVGCGNGQIDPGEECDGDPGCGPKCIPDRLVFLSSVSLVGALGGVDGADILCNQLASNAGIVVEGKFWAWLGEYVNGVDTSPATHIPFLPGRYVLITGDVVVEKYEDLYFSDQEGYLLHPVNRTEAGMKFQERVWTNVGKYTGNVLNYSLSEHCQGWTSTARLNYGIQGSSGAVDFMWTQGSQGECSSSARIYCFEGGLFEK